MKKKERKQDRNHGTKKSGKTVEDLSAKSYEEDR